MERKFALVFNTISSAMSDPNIRQGSSLEFLGAFCRVRVHLPSNGQSLLADVPSAQAARMGLTRSHQVFVGLSAERMQVFGPNASVA
jgi:hypothetical protein